MDFLADLDINLFFFIPFVIWVIFMWYVFFLVPQPRCPECDRDIETDRFFGSKFTCLCGVSGLISFNLFWANSVKHWISPNEQKENNNTD